MGRTKTNQIYNFYTLRADGKHICKVESCAAAINVRSKQFKFLVCLLMIFLEQGIKSREHYTEAYQTIQREKVKAKPATPCSLTQLKLTDCGASSEVMEACVKLVVEDGVPFKLFRSQNMKKLLSLACNATRDATVITEKKVRDRTKQNADALRLNIRKFLRNRLVSLKVDMATCRGREFIGEKNCLEACKNSQILKFSP